MRSQLNVILLKAVLQAHEMVTTTEQHVSSEWINAQKMDAVVEEVKLQKVLQWKQNQVSAYAQYAALAFKHEKL